MMTPFYLVGPTGSGKSDVAVALAERIKGEIVNADAFQLYAGLRILTARPSQEDVNRTPHHLYGVISPTEFCHAGRYQALARRAIDQILSRGKTPIVVGGSGLYIKTLTHGLSDAPAVDPLIRKELEAGDELELLGRLEALDPESASTIDPRNRRYLQRALEICLSTGKPASEARNAWKTDPPGLRGAYLNRPRESLYARIDARVHRMIESGAIEEVAAIPDFSTTALKAIGVREIQDHLAGKADLPSTIAQIQQASRRYSKRQMTWFRREKWLTELKVAESEDPKGIAQRIIRDL